MSNAFRYDQLSSQIRAAEARVQTTQNQVTTGKRINTPSDDASGTRRLIGLSALRSGIAGYVKNIDVAKGALSSTEQAYAEIGDLVQQAQTLAIQGATTAIDQASRDSIAGQVQSLQDRLVSLGNSQGPDGRYLFGGQMTDAKPFAVANDGTLTYSGNTNVPSIETGPSEKVKVGETGGNVSDLFSKLTALQNSLKSGDIGQLSDSRLGELEKSSAAMIAARGDVGRRMNAIEDTRSTHDRRDTELTDRASEIGEVDYATAIVDYTAAQSAYQAALQVASKGFSMGLMDFIR